MFGFKKKSPVTLITPFAGEVIELGGVDDPAFAQGMLGDGFAVVPPGDADTLIVRAPISGRVATVLPTAHAFGLVGDDGLEVLVHVGLDTVDLRGQGFRVLVDKGDSVTAGQPVIEVDLAVLREQGRTAVTPVVLSNKKQVAGVDVATGPAAEGAVAATATRA